MDLVTVFIYDIEAAFVAKKKITIIIINVQKAFNTLLKR